MRFPTSSCRKIRAISQKNGTYISIGTVSRCLRKKFDLKFYKLAAKPRLTSAMKKKNLSFANKLLHWTVEKWEMVLFFDQSTVQQFAVRKRHVQKIKYQRFNAKYTVSTVKHLQARCFGVISKCGTAGLYFFPQAPQ